MRSMQLHELELIHYSTEPLVKVHSVAQDENEREPMKPKGLWVSVENAGPDDMTWAMWCKDAEFNETRMSYSTRVYLAEDARILYMSSVREILRFTRDYVENFPKNPPELRHNLYADWPRLARQHDGIIIAPYQWALRLNSRTFWYYGWDCASGCIWNASAIERIERVESKQCVEST